MSSPRASEPLGNLGVMQIVIGRLGHTPAEVDAGAEQFREYWTGTEWGRTKEGAQVFETPEDAREHLFLYAEPDAGRRVAHAVFIEMLDPPPLRG